LDAGKICVNVRGGMIFQDHRQLYSPSKIFVSRHNPFNKKKLAEGLCDFTTAESIFEYEETIF
jgi:hypothetical protein